MTTKFIHSKSFQNLRTLDQIERFPTVPCIKRQSVAEHSFNVAWIVVWLSHWCRENRQHDDILDTFLGKTDMVVRDALFHDSDEAATGDIPAYNKPGFAEWSVEGKSKREILLKIADLLEVLIKCNTEQTLGNSLFWAIETRLKKRLRQVCCSAGWETYTYMTLVYDFRTTFGLRDIIVGRGEEAFDKPRIDVPTPDPADELADEEAS